MQKKIIKLPFTILIIFATLNLFSQDCVGNQYAIPEVPGIILSIELGGNVSDCSTVLASNVADDISVSWDSIISKNYNWTILSTGEVISTTIGPTITTNNESSDIALEVNILYSVLDQQYEISLCDTFNITIYEQSEKPIFELSVLDGEVCQNEEITLTRIPTFNVSDAQLYYTISQGNPIELDPDNFVPVEISFSNPEEQVFISLTAIDPTGCQNTSQITELEVFPLPILDLPTNTIYFTDSVEICDMGITDNMIYEWNNQSPSTNPCYTVYDNFISIEQDVVKYDTLTECRTEGFVIVSNGTNNSSNTDDNQTTLSLRPTFINNYTTLSIEDLPYNCSSNMRLIINDNNGQILLNQSVKSINNSIDEKINLERYSSGIYYISVHFDSCMFTKTFKVIKN